MSNQNPFDQQTTIPGVKKVIAVSSGKGGVGKSTCSINLALTLAKANLKVGLLDADIYGPSQPRMSGTLNQKPEVTSEQKIVPIERYGIKFMSMGYLVEEDLAVVWRGPMLFKAMNQLLLEVDWGDLDVLLIDLPPGTGDVQLSMVQKIKIDGAITVCTPQNIALSDVKKSVDMFARTGVQNLGVIENMAYFVEPDSGKEIKMYPQGDLNKFLEEKKLPHLGEIPFEPATAQACELGIPIIESKPESKTTMAFKGAAEKLGLI